MKIAFLHYHHSLHSRGAETFVDELSIRFKKENHETIILSHPQAAFASRSHLSILQRLFLDKVSLKIALWTIRSIQKLDSFNPDIVFSLNGGWQVLILRLWTFLKRKKLVVSGQSGPGFDDRLNLLVRPDLFVCLTKRQFDWANNVFHWPKQRFSIISNGVDLKKFSPIGPKIKLNLERPIIMIAAAAENQKRVEETIKAVSKLKEGSLLWLGDGPLKARIISLGNSLLGSSRFLHLSVPHSQIPNYYRTADLFTLCSQSSEAFGIAYLEAMATGLPVVAPNDASRREIVGNAGLYAKRDLSNYSGILRRALSLNWQDLPRKQAEQFSWDKVSSEYLQILKSLIK